VRADTMQNDRTSWFFQQTIHIHDYTGHVSFWIKSYLVKTRILVQNPFLSSDRLIELELMDIGLFNNIVRARVTSRQEAEFGEWSHAFQDPHPGQRLGTLQNQSISSADRTYWK
jgi:hypothetical protein